MQRLWKYLARYKLRYLAGGGLLLATATLVMAIPALTQRAVDAIAAAPADPGTIGKVAHYGGLIIALALAQAVVRTLSRMFIFNTGRDIEYDLRNDLFVHLETLPQSYYQSQQTGDLMSRLINDIGAVRLLLGPGVLTLINTPLYCVYAFTLMLMMNVNLTLAAVVPFPVLLWVVKRYSHQMMEAVFHTQKRLAEMSSFVQENLSGVHVVKSYVRETARAEEFAKINAEFKRESMDLARLRARVFPFMRVVSSASVLIVLWYGGTLVVAGTITLGQLVAFIAYLHILAWPVTALGWMISIFQRGRAALLRLGEILDVEPAIRSPEQPAIVTEIRGEVRFEDVEFAYPGGGNGHAVLDSIDLTVPAGSRLGLIGRTGSGKSTLVSLLPRLFDATGGRVTIDGIDVRDWDLGQLRAAVAFVPQDPFLFSRSIQDNIGFGRDGVEPDEMTRLVEMAALDSDLSGFPEGLATQVGERGLTMSGGQKQRITLARAIAREPKVLILDDALSSVDAETERRILDEIEDVVASRTTIIISHRVSAVRRADLIAVVDDGRIVERGTHQQLVARGGVYAELFRRQRLVEELEAM